MRITAQFNKICITGMLSLHTAPPKNRRIVPCAGFLRLSGAQHVLVSFAFAVCTTYLGHTQLTEQASAHELDFELR